jgi:hypothetical protein
VVGDFIWSPSAELVEQANVTRLERTLESLEEIARVVG